MEQLCLLFNIINVQDGDEETCMSALPLNEWFLLY